MLLDFANKDLRSVHTQKSGVLLFEPPEESDTTMSRFGQAPDAFRSLRSRNVPLVRAGLLEERQHPRQMAPEQGPFGGPSHHRDPVNCLPRSNLKARTFAPHTAGVIPTDSPATTASSRPNLLFYSDHQTSTRENAWACTRDCPPSTWKLICVPLKPRSSILLIDRMLEHLENKVHRLRNRFLEMTPLSLMPNMPKKNQ